MEQLPYSEPRDYNEVEKSLKKSIEFDWDGKVKRLQQFGQIRDWYLDNKIESWLKEAVDCYIMGSFKAASFFAGATLEVAMKAHAVTWNPPKNFENIKFYKIINKFYERGIINKNEQKVAFEIKNLRNNYGHGLIRKLANIAEKDGMKVIKRKVMLTEKGVKQIPDTEEEIIINAKNGDMELTFTQFDAEEKAWKTLKNVYFLLSKLFPKKTNQESHIPSTSYNAEKYHLVAL